MWTCQQTTNGGVAFANETSRFKFKNNIIIVEKQGGQATVFIRIMSMLLDATVFVIITSMLITRCDILAPRNCWAIWTNRNKVICETRCKKI